MVSRASTDKPLDLINLPAFNNQTSPNSVVLVNPTMEGIKF